LSQARAAHLADDERVHITLWSFSLGDSTGQHRHELDYVVVPVTGGTFDVTSPSGEMTEMTQQLGVPYFRSAGALHDVTSTTDGDAVFVEIELKNSSSGPS
jgi:quercetin dioxygenase-like cupin family protein